VSASGRGKGHPGFSPTSSTNVMRLLGTQTLGVQHVHQVGEVDVHVIVGLEEPSMLVRGAVVIVKVLPHTEHLLVDDVTLLAARQNDGGEVWVLFVVIG